MAGTVQTFLKVLIGANTKGFKKDMDDGEKAVQKFASETKGALDKFAAVFGVDLDDARRKTKAFGEGLNIMGKGFKASTAGTTGLTLALKILKTALIATGVGALVIALAALGTYFTKTEQGAKQLASAMAQVKAVSNVAKDRLGGFGSGLMMLIQGQGAAGWEIMKLSLRGWVKEADNARDMAKQLAESIYDLSYAERNFSVFASEQNIQLEELRLKAKDLDLTAQERLKHLEAAAAIEKKINKEALGIAAEKLLNAQTTLALDKDEPANKEALAAAYVNYNNLVSQSIIFERMLTKEKNALIKEIKGQLAAMKELNAATPISAAGSPFPGAVDTSKLKGIKSSAEEAFSLYKDFGVVAVDVSKQIEGGFTDAAAGVGEFFGSLLLGKAPLNSFGQLVGGVFADMAINVGKIAIGAGMAVLGIKKALMTLNPWVAIAAGGILVALGSAAKGALANAASGSGSSGLTGNGGGSNEFIFDTRKIGAPGSQEQKIVVTGKLVAEGGQLVAVIESENRRRGAST
jgi:hypothetical protein